MLDNNKNILGPFQIKPRVQEKPYTYSHLYKGQEYQARFSDLPGRRLIWKLEQEVLQSIIFEKGIFNKHLDFAGGTGRIAGVFEDYCHLQYVLDASKQMLTVAKKNLKKAYILQRDFNEGVPELRDNDLDLITAFRFFPNAEPELRSSAMDFIAQKIKKGGLLICNNHRNFWSVPYFLKRLMFRSNGIGMTSRQMITLAKKNDFELVRSYSMGLLPQTEEKAILPWKIIEPLEEFIFQVSGNKQRFGYNIIFLFKRL